jgi:hypothetical protein
MRSPVKTVVGAQNIFLHSWQIRQQTHFFVITRFFTGEFIFYISACRVPLCDLSLCTSEKKKEV